jgi:hypothetical protein
MERKVGGVLKFERATANGEIKLIGGSWSGEPVDFWIYSDSLPLPKRKIVTIPSLSSLNSRTKYKVPKK